MALFDWQIAHPLGFGVVVKTMSEIDFSTFAVPQ